MRCLISDMPDSTISAMHHLRLELGLFCLQTWTDCGDPGFQSVFRSRVGLWGVLWVFQRAEKHMREASGGTPLIGGVGCLV